MKRLGYTDLARKGGLLILGLCFGSSVVRAADSSEAPLPLWSHITTVADLRELRTASGAFVGSGGSRLLRVEMGQERQGYAWLDIPAPAGGWNLGTRSAIEATVTNLGTTNANLMFWAVSARGWDAVGDFTNLPPGGVHRFRCNLREKYPDGTYKVDPGVIKKLRFMARGGSIKVELGSPVATGSEPAWVRPSGRMEVPEMQEGMAEPGPRQRVRRQLPGDSGSGIYYALYLPEDWRPGVSYPVVTEYPGNIFYAPVCYSTGRPEQCVIGYGMTEGKGAIWISLPFIDREKGSIAENGWGNADDTAEYAIRVIESVCNSFGGDTNNLVLTGFSRGAIACGYIGLRNERIARLWKGFHACQHYDGDGWNGADMTGAIERARRFAGRSIFHTDNSKEQFQPVMDETRATVTYVRSGLGFHSCAMFLDDRPSTQQLRGWFWELVRPK